jgi:catechol 2,3-dioxygenase-like lactoylglutathione lyase family enzyme
LITLNNNRNSAIVVDDSDESLRFWRDALGFSVAGEAENYGIEQKRLNNVFGARLRITGLMAPEGWVGVEFLEYMAPSTGSPTPVDTHSNDLWHWRVNVVSDDPESAASAVRKAGFDWVSPGVIKDLDNALGYDSAALVRDGDGHGVLLRAD